MSRAQARVLRRNATSLEQRAWKLLRLLRDEGIAVRRQHPIGRYIADFAVMRSRLAIEIDGPLHESQDRQLRDADRDAAFAILGWRVVRFSSVQLDDDMKFLAAVRAASTPSPRGEGEGGGVNLADSRTATPTENNSKWTELHPAPQPPPLTGRGSAAALDRAQEEGEFAPHLRRRTRANRMLPPRRKT